MTIGLIFLMALASVAGTLIVLIRTLGLRWVLRNATWVDVGFTILVCFGLAGTITGLLIGIVAGLVMTGTLTIWKLAHARLEGIPALRRVMPVAPVTEPRENWAPGPSVTKPGPAEDWCPGGSAAALTV